jgi:hypothetical protein
MTQTRSREMVRTARQTTHLRNTVSLIANADYELGRAAREAGLAGANAVSAEIDALMCACIKLREGIAAQAAL